MFRKIFSLAFAVSLLVFSCGNIDDVHAASSGQNTGGDAGQDTADTGDNPKKSNIGDEFSDEFFNYQITGSGEVAVIGVSDAGKKETDLIVLEKVSPSAKSISSKGGYSVKSVAAGAFEGCGSLESVYLPESIVSIGKAAFMNCSGLKSANIPSKVTVVEEDVFRGCGFTDFSIPKTVHEVKDNAFSECPSLERISSYSETKIGEEAFDSAAVEHVITPESESVCKFTYEKKKGKLLLTGIKDEYKNEEFFEIPYEINGIPVGGLQNTFTDNAKVKKIVMHNNIQFIHADTFKNCTSLEEIELPKKILNPIDDMYGYFHCIEYQNFMNCSSLKKITFPEGMDELCINTLWKCTSLEEVNLPSTLKRIWTGAFAECSSLKKIVLPEGLEKIDNYAFEYCKKLEEVIIPDSVHTILQDAFRNCTGLKKVVLPSSLSIIDQMVFCNCPSLEELTIPSGVKEIWHYAFFGCKKLHVEIPEGVENIGCNVFYGCESMKDLVLPHSLKKIGCSNLYGCARCSNFVSYMHNKAYYGKAGYDFEFSSMTFRGTEDEWNSVEGHDNYSSVIFSPLKTV